MRNFALTITMILLCSIVSQVDLCAQRHGGRGRMIRSNKVIVRNNAHFHASPRVRVVRNRPYRYSRSKVVIVRPRRVRTIAMLPIGYTTLGFRGRNYYYYGGNYYNYYGNVYNVIAPPVGLRIKVLPPGYRKIFIGPVPSYYYMGAYYKEVNSEYETVEPTVGTIVPELPEDNVDEVTIDGQTYYEFDNLLYKSIVTEEGVKYEVVGKLED